MASFPYLFQQSPNEEHAYGKWQITVAFPAQNEFYGYMVDNMYIDYPHDYHHPFFYDFAGATGYWEEVTIPMTINLDANSINATFKGNGIGPEEELVYERSTASFSASFTDVWIQPTADALGWEIGGTASITLHVDDELRSFYHPDDPTEAGYFVWFPNTVDETYQVPVEGMIYENMDSGLAHMEIYIGGEGINNPDTFFYLENTAVVLPEEFPLP